MRALLLANLSLTLVLTGLIWTIQLVHYPLFANVGAEAWRAYHAAHNTRITVLVAPLMVAELLVAVAWVLSPGGRPGAAWLGLALVLVAWGSTMLVSVPLHGRLAQGLDPALIGALVTTNWIRALAWTARGVLLLAVAATSA